MKEIMNNNHRHKILKTDEFSTIDLSLLAFCARDMKFDVNNFLIIFEFTLAMIRARLMLRSPQ